MFIVKLGGSVITDKSKKNCFKQEATDSLAEEIKKANEKLIVVHGAGSYGHILAKEYQLDKGFHKETQLQGFVLTHGKVQELNSLVLQSLHNYDVSAVSLPPHAILQLDNHNPSAIDYQVFKGYLDKNFTPVTFGDVVLDKTLGFSICSGDLLVHMLAEHFKPEKVVFVIDEDGLYTANPKTDKNATFITSATVRDLEQLSTTANKHDDVTEGMSGKINTIKKIARLGVDTVLLNGNKHDRLYDTLVGKPTRCTLVRGGKI